MLTRGRDSALARVRAGDHALPPLHFASFPAQGGAPASSLAEHHIIVNFQFSPAAVPLAVPATANIAQIIGRRALGAAGEDDAAAQSSGDPNSALAAAGGASLDEQLPDWAAGALGYFDSTGTWVPSSGTRAVAAVPGGSAASAPTVDGGSGAPSGSMAMQPGLIVGLSVGGTLIALAAVASAIVAVRIIRQRRAVAASAASGGVTAADSPAAQSATVDGSGGGREMSPLGSHTHAALTQDDDDEDVSNGDGGGGEDIVDDEDESAAVAPASTARPRALSARRMAPRS